MDAAAVVGLVAVMAIVAAVAAVGAVGAAAAGVAVSFAVAFVALAFGEAFAWAGVFRDADLADDFLGDGFFSAIKSLLVVNLAPLID